MAPARSNNTTRRPSANPEPARLPRRAWAALRRRPKISASAGTLVLAAVATVAVVLWPTTHHRYQPPVTARPYSAFTACLLTDSQGLTSTTAAPAWAAMQEAARSTSLQARSLSVNGADTLANTETYVNALAQRACDVIVSVGAQPNTAALARAGSYPKIHFILAGATGTELTNTENAGTAQLAGVLETAYRAWSK